MIGNGDIKTAADVARMFAETGCDAVMIGRAALGRPWIFQHIAHTLRTGESLPEPTPAERLQAALEHARLTVVHTRLREDRAMVELRGQIGKYGFGIPGAAALRDRLMQVSSLADVEAILLPAIERAQDYAAQGAPAAP